jgi:hypothetical protein
MSQMPDIYRLLEADEKNVREMQKYFAGYQGLSELLNEASVLYTKCCDAFGQTLSHEMNNLRDTPPDSPVLALTITHNFRALREQPKGQVGDNKKGAADNTL